jgi:ELWxxDGT repeat protein
MRMSSVRWILALTLVGGTASPCVGATAAPQLVMDINRAPDLGVSGASLLDSFATGNVLYFKGTSNESGLELWRSDGTRAGTTIVKDIWPGPDGGLSGLRPSFWRAADGTLLFAANDGVHGVELWRSDGTPAGTMLVKDIRPGAVSAMASDLPIHFANTSGLTFFLLSNQELWRTDGTAAGTVLVKTISPTHEARGGELLGANGTLFVAGYVNNTYALLKSDGTAAGTVTIKALPGPARRLTNVNGRLFFFTPLTRPSGDVVQLWSSDGTEAGTLSLAELQHVDGLFPWMDGPVVSSGRLFFTATTAAAGNELWSSDGAPGGTQLIDICPGACSSSANGYRGLTDVSGTLFLAANDGVSGSALWKTLGTPETTSLVKDAHLQSAEPYPHPETLTNIAGQLYFIADDGVAGRQLWRSDGRTDGTMRMTTLPLGVRQIMGHANDVPIVYGASGDGIEPWRVASASWGAVPTRDICAGPCSSARTSTSCLQVGARVFFIALDGVNGYELWTTDGTNAGTIMLTDTRSPGNGSSTPKHLTAAGSQLYFAAATGMHGEELWKSEGLDSGAVMVKDIHPGAGSSQPWGMTPVNGTVFFSAHDGTRQGLWRSNGTAATTTFIKEIAVQCHMDSYTGRCEFPSTASMNGVFFFAGDVPGDPAGCALWKSDGTSEGTAMVADPHPGRAYPNSCPEELTPVGNTLFFTANDGTAVGLWKSDGTLAGTMKVKTVAARGLSAYGDRLLFSGYDADHGREPWSSDGTEAGTRMVADIDAGPGSSVDIAGFVVSGGFAHFFAENAVWRTDGTAAQTSLVGGSAPREYCGPLLRSCVGGSLVDSNGTLFAHVGRWLWSTGGMVAAQIEPNSAIRGPLVAVGGFVFYTVGYDGSSTELWRTDGTPNGTSPVRWYRTGSDRATELLPDYTTMNLRLTRVGAQLYFTAPHPTIGGELWGVHTVLPTPAPTPTPTSSPSPSPTPTPPASGVVSDFNCDGRPDLVWRHQGNGSNYVWFMSGLTQAGDAFLTALLDLDWQIAGAGDFNGDRYSDLVWRNQATGANHLWFMRGVQRIAATALPALTDPWKLVGVANFDEDPQADLLWRHSVSGHNYVWFMRGTERVGGASLPSLTAMGWDIVGVGDFNADQHADILWRNIWTGENYVWFLQGTTMSSSAGIPSLTDTGWQIGAVADLNHDGHSDIVWRHQSSGDNYVWLMRGNQRVDGAALTPVPDLAWTMAAAGF